SRLPLRNTCRRLSGTDAGVDQLTYLDQVAVRVAHVAADLVATVDRRSQKLRSASAPSLIDCANVGDTDVQKGRCAAEIRGRLHRYGRFVVGGCPTATDRNPAVCQRDN